MFCKNCGGEIPNGANFCPYCGEKVEPVVVNSGKRSDYSHNPYEDEFTKEFIPPMEEEKEDPIAEEINSQYAQRNSEEDNSANVMANLSFTFGLISLFAGVLPLAILAVVFSKKGSKSKTHGYKAQKGKRLGIISIVLWTIMIVIIEILYIYGLVELI